MTKNSILLQRLAWFFIFLIFIVPHLWFTQLAQNFVYPKMILVDFAIATAALGIAFFKDWKLPQNKVFYFAMVGLIIGKMVSTLLNFNWVTFYSAVGALSFVILAFFIRMLWEKFELKLEQFVWPSIISISAIFIFVAIQFYHSRIKGQNPEPVFFSGPFGNINMMCEYLVFLLPWLMFLIKKTDGRKNILLCLVTFFALVILLVGQSRSVWLGIAVVFAYEAFKGMDRKQWLIYLLAILTYWSTQFLPTANFDYSEAKRGSLAKRETLYKTTVKMLAEKPLGIGGAEFEYGYIPYQLSSLEDPVEREKFNTPHSEFLKWGIENGWLYLISALIFLTAMLKEIWKLKSNENEETLIRTAFLVLFPHITFQFPFENAASFYLMAFAFGFIFYKIPSISWRTPRWMQVICILVAVGLFAKAGTQTYSKWIESQYSKDKEEMSIGCPVDRTNWRLCFFYSLALLEGSLDESFKNTQIQLFNRPFDFHALRALGFYYIQRNDRPNACEVTQVYNSFFKGKSYFAQFVKDNCNGFPNPVPYESSGQFFKDYLTWIEKHINKK